MRWWTSHSTLRALRLRLHHGDYLTNLGADYPEIGSGSWVESKEVMCHDLEGQNSEETEACCWMNALALWPQAVVVQGCTIGGLAPDMILGRMK